MTTAQHIQFEAKKHTLRQNQDGFVNVTFAIHPQESDINRLLAAPMGKRYEVVLVDLDELEGGKKVTGDMDVPNNEAQSPVTTIEDKKPNLVQQAAIIADKLEWNDYVRAAFPNMIERGAEAMRKILNVQSRKELATDEEAAKRFMTLLQRFKDYQNYGVA